MRTDKDIEELFGGARAPEPRDGLRERVLAAADKAAATARPARGRDIPRIVSLAVAATVILAVAACWAAARGTDRVLAEIARAGGAAAVHPTPQEALEGIEAPRRLVVLAERSCVRIDLAGRTRMIEQITGGDHNGS
jgi:hypothetical protein